MSSIRCPYLDLIARSLIEAYRRVEDRDVFCLSECQDSEISQLHRAMAEHRSICFLCMQRTRSLGKESVGHFRALPPDDACPVDIAVLHHATLSLAAPASRH